VDLTVLMPDRIASNGSTIKWRVDKLKKHGIFPDLNAKNSST